MSKPYIPQRTKNRFFVPPTLADDFTTFLDGDIPNTVMDFERLRCWYDKFEEDYQPEKIRGELYPDATKSRYINTDSYLNIRCDVKSGLRKGDMLLPENDDRIFLADWQVSLQSNNAPSRCLLCNLTLEVKRRVNEVVDDMGYLIEPEHDAVIVPAIPANAYRYEGKPDNYNYSNMPGYVPDALTEVSVQFNEYTDKIHIDDWFVWGEQEFSIVDIDRVGVAIDGSHGVLRLQAKKRAGGINYGE